MKLKKVNSERTKRLFDQVPATTRHKDVKRLVILLPVEEQPEAWVLRLSFQSIYFNFQNEVALSRIVIVNRQQ